ncbi:MAG TPA: RHS repeat-associated core domain-containing protein [Bryobacteraceae bacterium]|nr:RHS repeat-associated core domain-containing protein [Bryobacteraceae bacterium]
MVSNTYDGGTLTNVTGLYEHDDASYGTGVAYRGNVTTQAVPGQTTNFTYDITGTVVSRNDNNGHTVAVAPSMNNAVPGVVTPNSNSALATSYSYSSFLGTTQITGPNSSTASTTYDSYARPQTTTSTDGAQTTYTYTNSPATVTATTNGHYVKTTMDGFGRTIKVEQGDANGTKSTVDTVYGSCGCSPMGKVVKVSQPYPPGATEYWTVYTYDALGRTVSVLAPDGVSTTTNSYQGNVTTTTDAAGLWKTNTYDTFGNLKTVDEPNPAGGSDLLTTYTYDLLNHMAQASMTRGTTTQTRTWAYDATTQRLTSVTTPESGTVSYTYNADGTLATRTDAKGQKLAYTYDSYQRVTQIQRYPNGTTEDTCQRDNFYFDSSPFDSAYSQNVAGQLAAEQYGGTTCTPGTLFTEMYSYNSAGRMTAKRLRLNKGNNNADLNASFTYNNEGTLSSITYPNSGATYTYGFDSMYRPASLTDNQTTPVTWVNNVAYAPDNQLTQIARWNGSAYWTESRTYNNLNQLTRQTVSGVFDQEYDFSGTQNNGKLTGSYDHIAAQQVSYTYDVLGRLSTAKTANTSQWGFSWTYDGFGNRTQQTLTQGSGPTSSFSVDPATNRISTAGYTYDANGNPTAYGSGVALTYDVENRLATYNGSVKYAYAPDNHRVWNLDASSNQWVWFYGPDGAQMGTYKIVVNGTTLSLTTQDTSVQFAGTPVTAQSQTVLVDRLGSVRRWGSTSSNYYPYGEEQTTTAQARTKFGTWYRDNATGFDYAVNRHYIVGRFLTPDPYGTSMEFGIPTSFNRYTAVWDDPLNVGDPVGLAADYSTTVWGAWQTIAALPGYSCGLATPLLFAGCPGQTPTSSFLGGGGLGAPKAKMDLTNYPIALVNIVQNAFTQAFQALNNPRCAGLFEPNVSSLQVSAAAQKVLTSTTYRLMSLGPTEGARTVADEYVWINTVGAFFAKPDNSGNVRVTIPGAKTGNPVSLTMPVNNLRAFLLLHELGHQTHVFGADGGSPSLAAQNGQNSAAVLRNCFGVNPPQ